MISLCAEVSREGSKDHPRDWPLGIQTYHHVGPNFEFEVQNGSHRSPGDQIAYICSIVEGPKNGVNPPMSQRVRQTSSGPQISCQISYIF